MTRGILSRRFSQYAACNAEIVVDDPQELLEVDRRHHGFPSCQEEPWFLFFQPF